MTAQAFETMPFSEGNEDKLVENLRKAPSFIPELSLVAELDQQILGHILFTPLMIDNGQQQFKSLVLGPVSVLPEFQKKGIGRQLIIAGHQKARELGFQSVILIGHPKYYPRFGYKKASGFGLKVAMELPSDDVFMAVELTDNGLLEVSGMVISHLNLVENIFQHKTRSDEEKIKNYHYLKHSTFVPEEIKERVWQLIVGFESE